MHGSSLESVPNKTKAFARGQLDFPESSLRIIGLDARYHSVEVFGLEAILLSVYIT